MSNKEEDNPFDPCPKKRGRYLNPHVRSIKRSIWDVILWQLGAYNDLFFPKKMPEDFSYPNPKEEIDFNKPYGMWVNHSSFYLCIEGIHIITDPIWSERCSPFAYFGPRRLHHPPCQVKDLPLIDVVVLSHDHYDHFDKKTLLEIFKHNPEVTFLVPQGVKKRVLALGVTNIVELSWGEKQSLTLQKNKDVEIECSCVPSQHFSGRSLFDKNKTLWCGWVLDFKKHKKSFKKFYFVGDTGYNDQDFAKIGEVFGGFDLSLIPIGTYVPHLFMAPVHIGPKSAVKIHKEVKSKLSVGIHWNTFRLSTEGQKQPPYDLFLAMQKHELDPLSFRALNPGQYINW